MKKKLHFLAQRTIAQVASATGIGLHSGRRVRLVLHPAGIDHGIVFRRTDLPGHPLFRADAFTVGDTRLASTLRNEHGKISTVEHLMSACAGLGVDNLLVDLDAEEVPILDGSADPFLFLLYSGEVVEQDAPKVFWKCVRSTRVEDGDKFAQMDPFEGVKLDVEIEFEHPALKSKAKATFDLSEHSFAREIARARTFGFAQEVEALREIGLARGGSLENAIVLDDRKVINKGGLRLDEEFARHKLLDALGDLRLASGQFLGHYTARKPGHAINNLLLRALFDDGAVEKHIFENEDDAPVGLRFKEQTKLV